MGLGNFVDQAGVTRLRATGGSSTPFNGGTIHDTLTVEPPAGSEGVVVAGTDGDTTKLLDLSAIHTIFTVDSDGFVNYESDDTPALYVKGTGGTHAQLRAIDTSGGAVILRSDTGIAVTLGSVEVAEFSSSKFMLHYNAAPDSADLAAGDCALWFDQTNGAAKLMVKAKTANGSVVTGSLALA